VRVDALVMLVPQLRALTELRVTGPLLPEQLRAVQASGVHVVTSLKLPAVQPGVADAAVGAVAQAADDESGEDESWSDAASAGSEDSMSVESAASGSHSEAYDDSGGVLQTRSLTSHGLLVRALPPPGPQAATTAGPAEDGEENGDEAPSALDTTEVVEYEPSDGADAA